jgi:hypothetical protein
MSISLRSFATLSCSAIALAIPSTSQAYLGSFGPNDGYYPQYGTVLGDVTYYNAGQNGINAGGGAAMPLPADTGLWSLQTPNAGGVFASAVNRAAFTSQYPAYPPNPPNTVGIYLLGGHFPGRNNDGANLAFRNDTPVGTGAARYRYQIDTYDTGGPVPASVNSGSVSMSFYFSPNPAAPPPSDGSPSHVKFTMSLLDSSASTGFQWGYAMDNTVMWRDSSSNPWNTTTVVADSAAWDGVKFNMDLTGDTFGIDYFDASLNTWNTMVPAGTPMGSAMMDFTTIDWQLEDGVNIWGTAPINQLGGKNYFDDVSIVIPEPASLSLAIFGAVALLRRNRG